MKVGITGQSGFIGYHLTNYLSLKNDEVDLIPFDNSYFSDTEKLRGFVLECDTVVHLAGMNRGPDSEVYDCNLRLASQLVKTLEECEAKPYVIFASSTQEERSNSYGRSKKDATNLFIDWAIRNNAKFSSLIIPNVFGPFGKPNYNSVVATFCYQLTHDLRPKIQIDAVLNLIFVNDLVEYIFNLLKKPSCEFRVYLQSCAEIRVSEILSKLNYFKESYLKNHIIPVLDELFDVHLFNTFRSYIDADHFPVLSALHSDERGKLAEVVKEKTGGQTFYSFTRPGKTRGNHYHRRKIERFFVVEGVASIKLRRIGSTQIISYKLTGDQHSYVDIPLFYTHNITNIGETDLLTLFWTNELFNEEDADTYYEVV
ncbi:MAG: NAD-dependent epimerase/dehydratase family protein [archaeon]